MVIAQGVWKCSLALLVSAWVRAAHGERLFIGVAEADGYQSVLYGASAFSRVADLPLALELVNAWLGENFLLPSFSCVSASDTFRVVQTVDPTQPQGDGNPANVAILPLSGDVESVQRTFKSAYLASREFAPFTCYEQAKNTNLAPRVFIATAGRHLFTSVSQAAIQWAWDNRARLVDAPSQSIPGTVRVLVNPQRLADLLGTRSEQVSSVFNIDKLLREFDTFSFSLTIDGQAVALTARGTPQAGTALATLTHALRPPQPSLWYGLPDDAYFAAAAACDSAQAWDTFKGQQTFRLLRPAYAEAPPEAFSGDSLCYLAATRDKRGICWVRIEPLKNAEPVREAIRKLHTSKTADGVILNREPSRKKGDLQIETYALSFQHAQDAAQSPQKPKEPSTLFTLMTLFLKQAVLEVAVAEGHLVSSVGPPNSIDDQLENLRFSERPVTLQRRISAQDQALSATLCQGATLQMAALLRQIVTIMPGVKPEHLRAFPLGGDGATFGVCRSESDSITASLRIQSSEIAALQRINKNGREVLQELVFQLFSNQMLHVQDAQQDPVIKKP